MLWGDVKFLGKAWDLDEELDKLRGMLGADRFQKGKFDLASKLFETMMTSPNFDEFLTLSAYEYV